MKKIIIPTGYMGSGSSAITNLMKEYSNCYNKNNSFEYVFLHCPNGLFDLEDKILKGNNAIRSDEAIKTFRMQMNKLHNDKRWWVANYKTVIGPNFNKHVENFLNEITSFKYNGYWYTHEELTHKNYIKLLIRKPFKILLPKLNWKKKLRYNNKMEISYIEPKQFYVHSKKFINNVIDEIYSGNKDLVLDQFLLPFNLPRIKDYFDDNAFVIVVERDPRDVFISNKYVWNVKGNPVPFPMDVNEFCIFYSNMRNSEKIVNNNNILRIKFEDLIYYYSRELDKIEKFLGFERKNQIYPQKFFNIEISKKNTQLFRNKIYSKEVAVIEKKLSKYLYEFPEKIYNECNIAMEFED